MSTFVTTSRAVTQLKCVDTIAARNETKVKPIPNAKYRRFWFLINDRSAIFFCGTQRKASFIFPQGLSSADLEHGNDGSFILYGIMEDEVVAFNITAWVKNQRQKEKTQKRSKKKMKETDDADQSSSKRRRINEPEASNDAIFQSLLPSSQAPGQSGERMDVQKGLESLFQMDVIYLDEKEILFRGDNLLHCTLLDDLLVTLSHHLGEFIVSVSVCLGKGKSGSKISEFPLSSKVLFSHVLAKEVLPNSAVSQVPANSFVRIFETDRRSKPMVNSCATKLVSSSRNEMTSTNSELICHEIFEYMFGADSSFLESEVIVVGAPDGKILSCVLKGSKNRPGSIDHTNSSQLHSIVYDLEEPVVLVTSLNFNSEVVTGNDSPGKNSLLFVGRRGKICLMLFEEVSHLDSKLKSRFVERSIKGPVFSPVLMNGNCLFYSTGTELVSVKLEFVQRHDGMSNQRDVQVTSSEFPVRNVSSLIGLKIDQSPEDDRWCETFVAYSTTGKVQSFQIGNLDQSQSATSMKSTQAGQRMKALMLSIHDITKKIQSYHQISKLQDSILSELTKAGHLARLLLETRNQPEPFLVEVRFILQNNGSEKVEIVQCKMTNRTKWTFGQEWSVCASISGKGHCDGGRQLEQKTDHMPCLLSKPASFKSYKLENLKPDMFTIFQFPVQYGRKCITASYELKVYLHFKSPFIEQLPDCLEGNDGATGFMLPVCSKRIDILHMLRPINVCAEHSWTNVENQQSTLPKSAPTDVAMDTKLSKDQNWLSDTLKKITEEKMMIKPESQTNRRSQDVLRTTLLSVNEETLASLNLQGSSFIQWLFKDNQLISSSLKSESSRFSIQALSPSGTSVQIIQSKDDGDDSKTKIQVFTTSLKLLAEVWEAVHFRLDNSLEDVNLTRRPLTTSKEELAKLVISVQKIESSLGDLQDQPPSQMEENHEVLCGIYEEMRKLSLRL